MRTVRENGLTRREMMKLSSLGIGAVSASGWFDHLAAAASEQPRREGRIKQCVLVWLDGGPSHHDTFDPKPDAPAEYRGHYASMRTSVPGLLVTEKFPRLAPLMHHATLLRGMSTGEAEHGRARIYLHTGYKQGTGGLQYPTMGSLISAQCPEPSGEMPNFVVTGMHLNPANWTFVASPGYLGTRHAPLIVTDHRVGVQNLRPSVASTVFDDRLSVLEQISENFRRTRSAAPVRDQQTVHQRALRLMRSDRARAFDLSHEPARVADRYGNSNFGRSCLLARRLIEADVPFVEVYHAPTPGGWDSHTAQRVQEVDTLAMPQLDIGLSALIADMETRGLLDSTLIICMGEFGRTPRLNGNGGRDHYARAWTVALFGGGLSGGRIVGRTDRNGGVVEDRPISAADFMCTVFHLLGLSADASHSVNDRPVRAIDRIGEPIRELIS